VFGFDDDTPIYNQLMRERESTPIYDQLLQKYEEDKHEELVEPYQPSIKARVFSYEEYLALFDKEKPMAKEFQDMVNEFREAMDLPVADGPRQLTTEEQELHIKLIRDEFEKELVPAVLANDLVEIYDAGIDVMYFLIGLLSNAGMQIRPGFEEVHRSNMSKMDPETGQAIKAGLNDPSGEPVGKVLKGPNYFVPNLAIILNEQSTYGHDDQAVYKNLKVPLRLGFGGPKIGEGVLNMDHNGEVIFEGVMDNVTTLPVFDALGMEVTALSVDGRDAGHLVKSENSIRHLPPQVEEVSVTRFDPPIVLNLPPEEEKVDERTQNWRDAVAKAEAERARVRFPLVSEEDLAAPYDR